MSVLNHSEIWLPVSRHDGYEVSNYGRVRSIDRWVGSRWGGLRPYPGKLLTPVPTKTGYLRVKLGGGHGGIGIHILVAEAFIGPCPEGLQVRHWDGDPTHNTPNNLLYGTVKDNTQDRIRHGRRTGQRGEQHHHAKLDASKVKAIRASTEPLAILAQRYGVREQLISKVRLRQRWEWLT